MATSILNLLILSYRRLGLASWLVAPIRDNYPLIVRRNNLEATYGSFSVPETRTGTNWDPPVV